MNKISIIGASGHAKVVMDLAEDLGYTVTEIFDQDLKKDVFFQFKVNHSFTEVPKQSIIAIGNNLVRKKIAGEIKFAQTALIHPKSFVSKYAKLDIGTVLMAGVTVNADAIIGKHCIINTNCSIDHDCLIHDFVHISPNASLAGNVEVGECTHIGIGATIIQGVKIGKNCIIGAGAVIIRDVPDGQTIIGNPGKVLIKY